MSNKIDGFGQRPAAVNGGGRTSASARAGEGDRSVEQARGGDKVTLTDTARQMQRLAEAVASAPETDSARVAALKEAVESGQYKADPERIATRLVALERDLVGR
jgi:negative regulator of flagellin synthesis FlgM